MSSDPPASAHLLLDAALLVGIPSPRTPSRYAAAPSPVTPADEAPAQQPFDVLRAAAAAVGVAEKMQAGSGGPHSAAQSGAGEKANAGRGGRAARGGRAGGDAAVVTEAKPPYSCTDCDKTYVVCRWFFGLGSLC